MLDKIYEPPKHVAEDLAPVNRPKTFLRIACWLMSLISFVPYFLIGQHDDSGNLYSFGYGLTAIILSFVFSLPFYIVKYFRRPNPKRWLYLVFISLLTLVSIPALLDVTSVKQHQIR